MGKVLERENKDSLGLVRCEVFGVDLHIHGQWEVGCMSLEFWQQIWSRFHNWWLKFLWKDNVKLEEKNKDGWTLWALYYQKNELKEKETKRDKERIACHTVSQKGEGNRKRYYPKKHMV